MLKHRYKFVRTDYVPAGKRAIVFAVCMLACILLHSLIMLFVTDEPLKAYVMIFEGAFASKYQISQTLNRMLPIAMMGLALSLCLKAGCLFLGGNACVLAGGIGAAVIGLNFAGLPSAVAIPAEILFAMAFGMAVAGITALLRARLGISEIYVSVMMNYVLIYTSNFLVEKVWPSWEGLNYSNQIFENARWMTAVKGMSIHLGFLLFALLFAAALFIEKTPLGFRISVFGQNNRASLYKYKERANKKLIVFVILLVGAVGGLTGATSLCANQYRFSTAICTNYGFTGIMVARLGGMNPWGILIASALLGVLRNGAISMQVATGAPVSLVDLLEGLLLIGALCADMLARYKLVAVEKAGDAQ